MALHRKIEPVLALKPDIAIICETAEPERLRERSPTDWIESEPIWVGDNPNKGLGVFAFNGYGLTLAPNHSARLRYVLPVRVSGAVDFNLLAVWALNLSGGITRKHQPGPLRLAITRYREFLTDAPAIIAGDWNSNAIWDKPGWRINHMTKVRVLNEMGITSAYHEIHGEAHGKESVPTHYWRDRREDGPTYHIDFVFLPRLWLDCVTHFEVGTFADWCGNGLSDHVPIVIDIEP